VLEAVLRSSALRSTRKRFRPSEAQDFAMARPMPEAEPVIRAVLEGWNTG